MDSDQARAARIKEVCREILGVLNVMYGIGPFSFESICHGILHLELPDDVCVKKDLTYLVDKGYVKWTNQRTMMPWAKRVFKLTARGNEIANKISEDPALEP